MSYFYPYLIKLLIVSEAETLNVRLLEPQIQKLSQNDCQYPKASSAHNLEAETLPNATCVLDYVGVVMMNNDFKDASKSNTPHDQEYLQVACLKSFENHTCVCVCVYVQRQFQVRKTFK